MSEDEENVPPADGTDRSVDPAERAGSAESDRPGPAPLAGLADDLRRVAGMRTPKALRDAHLPVLETYLEEAEDPDRRLAELRRVLTDALGDIEDPQFHAAAEAIFAFGDDRWTPLRQRGERASASFNCSFDAFRRARRSTGISLLDETVRQVARVVARTREGAPSRSPGVPPTDRDRPAPDRRRRILLIAGAAAIVVLVVVIAVAVTTRGNDGTGTIAAAATTVPAATTSTAPNGGSCAHAIGAASDTSLRPYRIPFETQIAQLIPPGEPSPCAEGPITRWNRLVVQELTLDGRPDGALIATDPDHVMLMTEAEFASYHQIGGKDGTQAQAIAGLPRRRSTSASGEVWLIITDHGAMASAGPDQPGFYLGGPVWTNWQRNGEDTGDWGMPASNPLNNAVGYFQDFSKGRLTLSYTGDLTFHPVEDPAASLPDDFVGQILRHDDATTWYIDRHDVRHWIPDGATWECLHDRGARELDHVPGYAITTLELGDPASCSAED